MVGYVFNPSAHIYSYEKGLDKQEQRTQRPRLDIGMEHSVLNNVTNYSVFLIITIIDHIIVVIPYCLHHTQ